MRPFHSLRKPPLPGRSKDATFRVLVVDQEPQVRRLLSEYLSGSHLELMQAGTLAEARPQIADREIDLVLVEQNLPDGSGLQLAADIQRMGANTQTIVLSGAPSLERAIEAIRAGAADFIVKPLNLKDLNDRVRCALDRQTDRVHQEQRLQRLRRVCKKLNRVRHEMSQQVDILCNDLVTAYQELASQMQQVVHTSEFSTMIRDELDLEPVVRRTLEYMVGKAGPTNAALFLPSSADEYTLGGYVNYDCDGESAEFLLQHLADIIGPRLSGRAAPVHLTDNDSIQKWIGDDSAYLADRHVVAVGCQHKAEVLAAIVLFRDADQPFEASLLETCSTLSGVLGESLAKIIRVHHRSLSGDEGDGLQEAF